MSNRTDKCCIQAEAELSVQTHPLFLPLLQGPVTLYKAEPLSAWIPEDDMEQNRIPSMTCGRHIVYIRISALIKFLKLALLGVKVYFFPDVVKHKDCILFLHVSWYLTEYSTGTRLLVFVEGTCFHPVIALWD